ncbi:MAG: trigger factor [Bacteroidetes bacterium]|nr:trigger factor [Bacteroidota bacterium]
MNITRENTGELTATVRIEIQRPDYEEKVIKQLKDFQHKANIPGFRPGKVPLGLVRKMHGKAIIADEVNRIIGDALAQYIQDEKLEVLGNPLLNTEKTSEYTFESEQDFEFYFDLGMAPPFLMDLAAIPPVDRYVITVSDTMVDTYIEDMRKRYGNDVHPEVSGNEDIVSGEIVEMDADLKPVENGTKKSAFINPSLLVKEDSRKKFTGLKKEDKLVITQDFFESPAETAKILGISADIAAKEDLCFELTVNDIYHIEPAILDEEFFKKVYPGDEIATEEDFRERVRKDASASFSGETDKLFYRHASDALIRETPMNLPDPFLKRWLVEHKESKLTPEDVEKEYNSFAESMKWQLIENKLIRDFDIKVEEAEIRNFIKGYFMQQIPMNTEDEEVQKRFDSLVDTVMKNTEQVQKINDDLYNGKLLGVIKANVPAEDKEITYEEFIKLASAKQDHDHEHHHDHEHGHDHDHDHEHEHHHSH